MSVVLGLNAKLLRGAAGTQGATEMKNVKDLTLSIESGDADVTTRAAKGWRASVATLKEATLEFEMNYDTEDEDFGAVQDAFFNNTPLAFFVSDGAGNGLDADWVITGFNVEQPLEEATTVSVTAKPTVDTRAPQWVEGAGGSEG